MDRIRSLNGEWTLQYAPETKWTPGGMEFPAQAPQIKAQVPGNVELDLHAAGIEPEPFFGDNLYAYRKYEFYMWKFSRTFALEEGFAPEKAFLRLQGVNTYAKVLLNGAQVGETDNMLIEWEFDVTEAIRRGGENRLEIVIRSAANRAREEEYSAAVRGNDGHEEYVWQRKPAHSFGWDIMPRFPSAGLWRGVEMVERGHAHIEQSYYATTAVHADGSAQLLCKWRFATQDGSLEGYQVRLEGNWISSGYELVERRFTAQADALFCAGSFSVRVPDAKLWWPKGYGKANLYEVRLSLWKDGVLLDEKTEHIGLRLAELVHKMASGDEGEFKLRVNHVDIFAKGSNWVPLDAMHSRDAQRVGKAVELLSDLGCNIVRCWGGNVYEDHAFFDLCDREGIMVWQDFAMGCAVYPQEERFYDMIRKEAAAVVKKLRNHASIVLWAGDNEVDEGLAMSGLPERSRYNAITREVLPEAVRAHDPYRVYLPSSPYIEPGIAQYDVPEQHNWGARAWYKSEFYKDSSAHFISECGYHGCPAPQSLEKFLPQESLWPMENEHWRVHSTEYSANSRGYDRNRLMADQVKILFGEVPDDPEEFAFLSQCSQAEAKKFFIERARLKKWRRTGIIWWNLLDGWPQISDAVVDYYFEKKRAYAAIRRAQRPLCLMMDELRDWTQDVVLGNDGEYEGKVRWRVVDGDTGAILKAGLTQTRPNENQTVATLRVNPGEKKLYLLYCEAEGETCGNHYIAGFPAFDAQKMR
ncbi:MAG: glycoside hydrolase family 2 TIM barrel-domain containing protein, partial [Eubacteriales bacterium]|nr:glycoside hydrolase family 2 TIM barrel-domain containing protein [Eubacteriales bacterium]